MQKQSLPQNSTPIPYHFTPRDYQIPFLAEVEKSIEGLSTVRNFVQMWHRRSGKDKTGIAAIAPMRLIQDPCLVKYVYPNLVMGRANLWDGIGGDGFRYLDHLPEAMRAGQANQTRMTVPIITEKGPGNDSIFQIGGSDNPDSLRGGNPKMFIFSEWSEQDPYAWEVVEPIMRENDGISIFNFTPKGNNHAKALVKYAKQNPDRWLVSLLTAEDTGIFSSDKLKEIREDILQRFTALGRGEDEAMAYFEQEYMCSFDSPVIGSYYGAGIRLAESEGRIGSVPYERGLAVNTVWDLGMDDSTTIWFFQVYGQEIRFIDYYESSGEGLEHYARVLQERKYIYGSHFAPHDIMVRELGTGKSRFEIATGLGIKFQVAPNLGIDEGINAARSILAQCWFDAVKCRRGVDCLKNYHKEWDERNKVFRLTAKHDWSSHGCCCADTLIYTTKGMKKIVDICNGDFVVLGNEKAKVIKSGLVGYKDTIIIELNDGSNLEVTGNHPVFTTRGIVYADELVYDDVVIQENDLWKMKSLMGKGLREEFINYIEELNTGYGKGGAFIAHKKMGLKHFFIEIFGKIDMGSYQGVTKLCQLVFGKILEMKTGKLGVDAGVELSQVNIPFKSFRVLNIIENRLVTFIINIMAKDCIGRFGSITILKFLQNIIYIIAMGIRQIIRLIIYSLYLILIIPNFLLRLINGLVQMKIKNNLQNRVGDLLQLGGARVVKIRAGRLKIPVYDLTVEKHHCYLANGILVSNSDAFRIFAVGYRRAKPAVVQNNNPGGVSYLIPGVG